MDELVIGADLGGTSTRLTVATTAGSRPATVEGAGGNPTTHGVERAAAELSSAARRALSGLDPAAVAAVVIGVAGRATLDDKRAADIFAGALAAAGVTARPVFVGDAEVAFCSATPAPDGTVLLAGTGAMAVRIRDRRTTTTSDGLGWLLGDEGSAYWLGREAVRAAIAAIGGTGPATTLVEAVSARLLDTAPGEVLDEGSAGSVQRRRSALIRAVAARPPIQLAALAPLVVEAEAAGDAVAAAICDDAAARLVRLVGDVRGPAEADPLVLNGGVVRAQDAPVGRRVRRLIAERFAGEVLTAADGIAGAAWLAVRDIRPQWSGERLAQVHALLTAPAPRH
ncbi:N-acetylglucosamine kinase [Actinoplanes sp. CA-142083]|uniref:N-acetylglucosamine kinase n=1 Tax=Actinoplanes sp. CA-142083 TaxID=3239903 RepID=UPI003D8F1272